MASTDSQPPAEEGQEAPPLEQCFCAPTTNPLHLRLYGVVYDLFCFQHQRVTPQAEAWLSQLPALKYSVGAVGTARCGKSYKSNEFAEYIKTFVEAAPANERPVVQEPLEVFQVSSQPRPMTKGIQAMALPRFCDQNGAQLNAQDGCFIICDAEGLELGDTSNHRTILGIMSRFVTFLSFFEVGHYTQQATRSLGRLVQANVILRGSADGEDDQANNGQTGVLPELAIVVNKYDLAPPQPDHATFIAHELAHNPLDRDNNIDRAAVRRMWLASGRLKFHTIPVDATLVTPSLLVQLPAPVLASIQEPVRRSTEALFADVLSRTRPFTLATASPNAAPAGVTLDGQAFTDYCGRLIQGYSAVELGDPFPGILQATIRQECTREAQSQLEYYEQQKAPQELTRGRNDVDGARGTADDGVAQQERARVMARHQALATACLTRYTQRLNHYTGLGCDADIQNGRSDLQTSLNTKGTSLGQHWDHMRSLDHSRTRVENSTEDGPVFQRVHHTQEEQVWFHTVTHYFWCRYLHRFNTTRTIHVRFNGDEIHGPWQRVGAPSEVQVGDVWHGGAP